MRHGPESTHVTEQRGARLLPFEDECVLCRTWQKSRHAAATGGPAELAGIKMRLR